MNVQHDPDAILAAWLDEGPTGSRVDSTRDRGQHSNDQSAATPHWVPRGDPR